MSGAGQVKHQSLIYGLGFLKKIVREMPCADDRDINIINEWVNVHGSGWAFD